MSPEIPRGEKLSSRQSAGVRGSDTRKGEPDVVVIPRRIAGRLAVLRRLLEDHARRGGYMIDRDLLAAFDVFDQARRGADAASEFRRSSEPVPGGWVDSMTAATALGITDRAVRKRCIEGRIVAAKDRTGSWRIDPQELT